MPSVSVIVPVYNVEEYLPRCLDSLLSQSLQDIEIICIDDGSKDSSGAILDDYALRSPKIKAVHVNNGGVSRARNTALSIAQGDYIGFIDSDDYASPGMFSTLLEYARRSGADIVQCSYDKTSRRTSEVMSLQGTADIITALMDYDLTNAVWDKLYRKDVIEGVRFPEDLKFAEDFEFNARAFVRAERVTIIPDSLLFYTERDESESHHSINNDHIKGFRVYDYLENACAGIPAGLSAIRERELSESLRFLESTAGHSDIESRYIDDLIQRIRKNRKCIASDRYLSTSGKVRVRFAVAFPRFYLLLLKLYKKVRVKR